MDLQSLYKRINLQNEMIIKLNNYILNNGILQLNKEIEGLLEANTAYQTYERLKEKFKDEKDNTAILLCYLLAALKCYELYKSQNIDEKVFDDTMRCFTRFIEECKEKTGEYDFDRPWWTHKQTSQVIYRIGELEYEFMEDKTISIHIPSDANMGVENLKKSLIELKSFVEQHKKEYINSKISCCTWLLSPKLKDILKENSKILNFQKCFNIIETYPDNDDCFVWVFKCNYHTNFELLPENTSLQRYIKELLINGQHLGSAYGIIKD